MRALRIVATLSLAVAAGLPAAFLACTGGATDDLAGTGTTAHGDAGFDSSSDATTTPITDDAPSEFIPDVAIDTFLPLNAVDAADIPDGGAKVTPGVIKCGGGTCNAFADNQCCADDDGGACLSNTIACPSGGGSIACNESADCVVGKVCCGFLSTDDAGGGPFVSSVCAASCTTTPPMQLCRTNGECGDAGPCVVQNCPNGRAYELCGAFSGPSPIDAAAGFACTPQ